VTNDWSPEKKRQFWHDLEFVSVFAMNGDIYSDGLIAIPGRTERR
jgi:hypothetical protein